MFKQYLITDFELSQNVFSLEISKRFTKYKNKIIDIFRRN